MFLCVASSMQSEMFMGFHNISASLEYCIWSIFSLFLLKKEVGHTCILTIFCGSSYLEPMSHLWKIDQMWHRRSSKYLALQSRRREPRACFRDLFWAVSVPRVWVCVSLSLSSSAACTFTVHKSLCNGRCGIICGKRARASLDQVGSVWLSDYAIYTVARRDSEQYPTSLVLLLHVSISLGTH